MILVPYRLDQSIIPAKLAEQCFGVVAFDGETAALRRSIGCKRPDDHVAAWTDCDMQLRSVARPVARLRQEMKYGSIVPNRDLTVAKSMLQDVRLERSNTISSITQARSKRVERRTAHVEDRDVRVPRGQKRVGKR